MAKPGRGTQASTRASGPKPATVPKTASEQGEATRGLLVEATIATLREEGFAGTSARSIAQRAGVNQALVFYHFGSVANLLIAALDATSARRMQTYQAAVAEAGDIAGLAAVATRIFREDLDGGHMSVLAEIIGGASSVPGLGAEVSARMAPWINFTEAAVADAFASSPLAAVLPVKDLAYGIVALYLGIELLAHLDGDRSKAESLLATAAQFASLLALFAPPQTTHPSAQGSK